MNKKILDQQIKLLIAWIVVIVYTLLIIIAPISSQLLDIIGMIFYFFMPIVLVILHINLYRIKNKNNLIIEKTLQNNLMLITPFLGLISLILLTFIRFINSILLIEGRIILITFAIILIVINTVFIFMIFKNKYQFKRFKILLLISLFTFYIFIIISMFISDYEYQWWHYLY